MSNKGNSAREFYIVSAKTKEVKAFDGKVLTKKNATVWLGESEGYPQCSTNKLWAKEFTKVPTLKTLNSWDGMPWYYQLMEDSVQVYKVSERQTYFREEEELKGEH